jgi:transposase
MLAVDRVFLIRHKVLVEKQSRRHVARDFGISRNTLRRYLQGAQPGVRSGVGRGSPKSDAVRPIVLGLLAESVKWTEGKQRLTLARLHEMVRAKGFDVGVSCVGDIVREERRRAREVFVPLDYPPGDLAEVDFFEVFVDIAGVRRRVHMFVMRLMHSKRDFAWMYERQDQVAFLDGHVRAFAHFNAVPHRIAYDNLKAAVVRVLVGSERELSARFAAMASHYLLEPCFARPRTGHDKGGVESRGKHIRWQHLVPIPATETLEGASRALLARLDAQNDGERFAVELASMIAHAPTQFRAAAINRVSVDSRSLVRVGSAAYSVPCTWARLEITAFVGADTVEFHGPDGVVSHARVGRRERSIVYRHYLRELSRKPQALRQVSHKLIAELGEPFAETWRVLVESVGPKRAAQTMARVLSHLETQGENAVRAALVSALARGEPPLVALAQPAPEQLLAARDVPARVRDLVVESASASSFDVLLDGAL